MWMDPANHGGVKGKIPLEMMASQDPQSSQAGARQVREQEDGEEGQESDVEGEDEVLNLSDDEDTAPDIEMNWNLARFLPEAAACQTNYNMIIAGYILAVFNHLQDEHGRSTPGSTPVRRKSSTQTQPVIDTGATPGTVQYCQTLVQDDMCQQMFSITQKIQKKLSGMHGTYKDLAEEFPVLPGSHLPLKNPALEFVKSVSQVLSLDANITNQVTKMKRDLLKLIGVGEFADIAAFRDPCLSYILPEVICRTCNYVRDLDLCRDPYLAQDGNNVAVWSCVHCKTEYDLEEIENCLLDAVQRSTMAYVLQDLQCMKCKGVKETNLSKNCKCAGNFTTTASIQDLSQKLQTFRNIARCYNMALLQEQVDWLLNMSPMLQTAAFSK